MEAFRRSGQALSIWEKAPQRVTGSKEQWGYLSQLQAPIWGDTPGQTKQTLRRGVTGSQTTPHIEALTHAHRDSVVTNR